MLFKTRYLVVVSACALVGWVGLTGYRYFFDTTMPLLSMLGLEDSKCYSGDVTCQISTSKNGTLSLYLDEQPLISDFKLSSRSPNHPFVIPTKTIGNGRHSLKIAFCDGSFRKNKVELSKTFKVDNLPLQAAFIKTENEFKVFQGRTLHIQFQANKELKNVCAHALAASYPCVRESSKSFIYECYIPIACEETPNEYLFSIDGLDNVGNKLQLENKFQIVGYPFKKQQNLTFNQETIKKEKEIGLAMNDLEISLSQLAQASPDEKLWRGSFCTPIDIAKVTCDFGTIRTTQEKGRYMHKALDVINTPRSVVWATQDGVIALKERYAHSGNTIVIDHGCGVLSLFFHLEDFAEIKVGQKIAKGNPIGTLGKTGYATGYHLHWELRVNNIAVDPMQWTKQTF